MSHQSGYERFPVNQGPVDQICPLCRISEGTAFYQDSRTYFRCPKCQLVFVLSDQFLSPQDEKSQYDFHENSADDPGYRPFFWDDYSPRYHSSCIPIVTVSISARDPGPHSLSCSKKRGIPWRFMIHSIRQIPSRYSSSTTLLLRLKSLSICITHDRNWTGSGLVSFPMVRWES